MRNSLSSGENNRLLERESPKSFTTRNRRNYDSEFDNPAFEQESFISDGETLGSLVDVAEQNDLFEQRNNRGVTIMIVDSIVLVVEYLQIFALLMSLSLRWTWPVAWNSNFSFLFLFNLDFWEFAKMLSGNYVPARNYFIPSSLVPVNYLAMLLCWLIILIIATFAFFAARWIFVNRLKQTSFNYLMDGTIITAQILALPIGVQISKLFWCVPTLNVLDVNNDVQCWSSEHIVCVVLALLVFVAAFVAYPVWLTLRIRSEVITSNSRKHEGFLQLRHCEDLFDLDSSWRDRQFIAFASFNRFWVYHRPFHHVVKLFVLCCYAFMFNIRLVQSTLIFTVLALYLIICIIKRPYRVTSFNVLFYWCLMCLTSSSVIGAMQNIEGIQSVFLLPDYIMGELILINSLWFAGVVLWFVYFALRCTRRLFSNSPLWPNMLHHGMDKLPANTKRYMVAAVKGRQALKRAQKLPALLAPVHELSHHVQVTNALAREAEYIKDPMHASLRDVLDELIEYHARVAPVSIFAESLKIYVQNTVSQLLQILPAFSERLQQREFDLILVPTKRRRILLKMFAVACFMRAGRGGGAHESGVRKLGKAPVDEGFHEEEESVIVLGHIDIDENNENTQDTSASRIVLDPDERDVIVEV